MITTAIVFAAGSGARFGRPKQFEPLGGERVIDRVVRTSNQTCDRVVLVLPDGHEWTGEQVDTVVVGGATHGASVRNGMAAVLPDTDVVVLASASHPLGSSLVYRRVIDAIANGADASAPIGHLPDAIKRRDGRRVIETVFKGDLATAQAPSAFAYQPLFDALATGHDAPEELQLIEEAGGAVVLVDGEDTNLHITTPLELQMAEAMLPLVDGTADPGNHSSS